MTLFRKDIHDVFTPRSPDVNPEMYIDRVDLEKDLYKVKKGSHPTIDTKGRFELHAPTTAPELPMDFNLTGQLLSPPFVEGQELEDCFTFGRGFAFVKASAEQV